METRENIDREQIADRSIYQRYVIDDGWNLPKEEVKIIDLEVKRSWDEAVKEAEYLKAKHKGEWLTMEVAKKYRQLAAPFVAFYDRQNIETVRELTEELKDIYGITELEAINILNGYHIRDYVEKYYRIENCIPEGFDPQRICNRIYREYARRVAI